MILEPWTFLIVGMGLGVIAGYFLRSYGVLLNKIKDLEGSKRK